LNGDAANRPRRADRETKRSESRRVEGLIERAIGVQARHARPIDSVYLDEIARDDDLAISIDNRIGPKPAAMVRAKWMARTSHGYWIESRIDSAIWQKAHDPVGRNLINCGKQSANENVSVRIQGDAAHLGSVGCLRWPKGGIYRAIHVE